MSRKYKNYQDMTTSELFSIIDNPMSNMNTIYECENELYARGFNDVLDRVEELGGE